MVNPNDDLVVALSKNEMAEDNEVFGTCSKPT